MRLLETFLLLINLWRPAFCKGQAFKRVQNHAVACICALGRHTITNLIIWLGKDQENPSSDYRLYSEYKWNVEDLFNPLLLQCLPFCPENYIVVGADDTRIRKTGKKIPGTAWGPDRMGPKFQVNLIWCQRFLQFSCLLPLHDHDKEAIPRGVPVRFIHAPPLQKPGKRASVEDNLAYQKLKKIQNLSITYVEEVEKLRNFLNENGQSAKKLLMVGDGSFCNRICMGLDTEQVESLMRTRKNARLCFQSNEKGHRFYSQHKFTPEEVRKNNEIPWITTKVFYGGEWRQIRYKEVLNVLWQGGTKKRPLRLFVLAPLPYVKGGIRSYRDPAYLLCTDFSAPPQFLIQSYLNRWQIEVNFREEKSILGVGEAQVRNDQSIFRQPAFVVATYAALLLSSILAYKDKPHTDFGEIPYWRDLPRRPTCRALVGLMRQSLLDDPVKILKLGLTEPMIAAIFGKAA